MATEQNRYHGGRVLVFVMGAFKKMPGNVNRICDLARIHVSYY